MVVLYILIPLALVLGAVAIGAFWWAVRSGQFDDSETPPLRILFDDDTPKSRGDEDDEGSPSRQDE